MSVSFVSSFVVASLIRDAETLVEFHFYRFMDREAHKFTHNKTNSIIISLTERASSIKYLL